MNLDDRTLFEREAEGVRRDAEQLLDARLHFGERGGGIVLQLVHHGHELVRVAEDFRDALVDEIGRAHV